MCIITCASEVAPWCRYTERCPPLGAERHVYVPRSTIHNPGNNQTGDHQEHASINACIFIQWNVIVMKINEARSKWPNADDMLPFM